MYRHPLALLLITLLSLGLGGCLYDQPLTDPQSLTSPNIDSRLLGVFEFRQGVKKKNAPTDAPAEKDSIQRLAVLPLGPNRYVIYHGDFGKKPARVTRYLGWLSRVDATFYLSFQDQTEGSGTFGRYGFVRFEWEFPGNFLISAPDMKDVENAPSPYEMRKALREKLKAGTAFPFEATYWKKIARVWWDPANAEAGTTIPPEFEKGTDRENPAL